MERSEQHTPRLVTDWYTDAIAVLDRCRDRAYRMRGAGPAMQNENLAMAMQLAQQIVRIEDPEAW